MKKIIIAVVVLLIAIGAISYFGSDKEVDVTGGNELRVGYIVFEPTVVVDANTGELSGISYDIVEAVAKELNMTTNWVEEVGWGTALEGLNTNRYDILGTQMWPNDARERVATFTIAPMDSVMYPYVKSGDTRFDANNLQTLNSSEVRISAIDGSMEVFVAAEDYPNAQLNALPQLASFAEIFLNIVQDKADVTFAEPSAAEGFLENNPGSIERLGDTPVRSFGNSFAVDKDNTELADAWNEALTKVMERGEIEEILKKYGAETHYSVN